jgi:oxygen-independent coproporphyrinogen-3 oxidase
LLSPSQFKSILESIRQKFDLSESAEITMEANPGTVSVNDLRELRGLGINRISFGAQSANGEELRMLERTHNFLDVIEAVSEARRAGFDNLNLDLIYGLPEQTLDTWKATIARILELNPEHISAYALTLEHGTPFGNWSARGMLPIPDPDAAAEMYEWASDALEAAGYIQYEISNWARGERQEGKKKEVIVQPRFACRHNLQYWRCLPYLGLGAGAHGYANGIRYSNVLRIKTYIERLQTSSEWDVGDDPAVRRYDLLEREKDAAPMKFPLSPATVNQHTQTPQDDISEFMIMGLRLTREGISPVAFQERFGHQLSDVYRSETDDLRRLSLLEWASEDVSKVEQAPDVLRLTSRGRLLGNQVFMRFV